MGAGGMLVGTCNWEAARNLAARKIPKVYARTLVNSSTPPSQIHQYFYVGLPLTIVRIESHPILLFWKAGLNVEKL